MVRDDTDARGSSHRDRNHPAGNHGDQSELSSPGQQAIRDAVFDLHQHISKEEDGIFPASLTTLSGDEWDASIEAWHAAHPGSRMIQQ